MAFSISLMLLSRELYNGFVSPVYGIKTNTVFAAVVGTNGLGGVGPSGSSLPQDARAIMEMSRKKKCLSI